MMGSRSTMFDRIANRIRRFLQRVSKATRHHKTDVQGRENVKIDLLTVDIPQVSLADEISWGVIESGLVSNATVAQNSSLSNLGLDTYTPGLEVQLQQEKESWDGLFQDNAEPASSFFVFASVTESEYVPTLRMFGCFKELPFELRLKIWHLTMQPRLVHWNTFGANRSHLTISRKLPVILQVCRESRLEGLNIFKLNRQMTCPFFFNPKADTVLWTRYPNCPRTFDGDAQRLSCSPLLGTVRHFAILLQYWNAIISQEEHNNLYAAIRRAPKLELVTLVDDYFLRRSGYSQLTYGRVLKLVDMAPEENDIRTVRCEKELRVQGKEKLWNRWDAHFRNSNRALPCKFPDIRFARAIVEMP